MWKLFIFTALLVASVNCSPGLRQLIGACVEECLFFSNSLNGGCADGYECRSNGCGHTCQPVAVADEEKRQFVDSNGCPLMNMCGANCYSGYAVDGNGCGTCSCAPTPLEEYIASLESEINSAVL